MSKHKRSLKEALERYKKLKEAVKEMTKTGD